MPSTKYIWTILLCAVSLQLGAQQILKESAHTYSYEGQEYRSTDMSNIFQQHSESHEKYEHYLLVRKYVKRDRFVGGALMLISPVLTLVAVGEAISNPRQGVDGLTIFSFVTLTAGTGLVVYSFRKKQYLLDESVTLFNSRLDQSVHLGTTAHGVGLVYTF